MTRSRGWLPEWNALLGTMSDYALAVQLGVHRMLVRRRRVAAGIPGFSGKMKLQCGCGRVVFRKQKRAIAVCRRCRAKQKLAWDQAHRDAHNAATRRWHAKNKDRHNAQCMAWARAHPEKVRRYYKNYRRREKQRNAAVVAALPCLDCGLHHSVERREAILRRVLPCETYEIHDAWPCLWGAGGLSNKGDAGEQRLYRDLKAIGAVRVQGMWSIPGRAAA